MVEQQIKKPMNNNIQKARAVAAANKAARLAAAEAAKHTNDHPTPGEKKELTEQDIVKQQIEEKTKLREVQIAEDKQQEVLQETPEVINIVVAPRIVPELIQLPGGKYIAKQGGRILVRGTLEKVQHYIDQFN